MAREEELEIEIDATGQVRVHVKGVPGSGCLDYMEAFRALLGPVESKELTPEYYEAETQVTGQQQLHRGIDVRRGW
jgi:hypothetical protein